MSWTNKNSNLKKKDFEKLCVTGGHGSGKTTFIKESLNKYDFVEVTPYTLRSVHIFTEFVKDITSFLYMDCVDCKLPAYKTALEHPLMRLVTIDRGRTPPDGYKVKDLGDTNHWLTGMQTDWRTQDAVHDMETIMKHTLFKGLDYKDVRDKWSDHGFMIASIHSNYLNSKADPVDICEYLSVSDLYDTYVFQGRWVLMDYLYKDIIEGLSWHVDNTHNGTKLLPGSVWTKFNHLKNRETKLKRFFMQHSLEMVPLLIQKGPDIMNQYGITRSEFDVMKHFLRTPLTPREITLIKKHLLE